MGQTTRATTHSPFAKQGCQSATIISVKGRRRPQGDRGFQVHYKLNKDGTEHYITIRETDDVVRGLTPFLADTPFVDIYSMKVDEMYEFPVDNQPQAIISYKANNDPFVTNIMNKEKPKVTEEVRKPPSPLDEFIPRCKAHDKPADELTMLCDECVKEKAEANKRWLPLWQALTTTYYSFIVPACRDDIELHGRIHDLLDVKSLTELKALSNDEIVDRLDAALVQKYQRKQNTPKSNGEGGRLNDNPDQPIEHQANQHNGQNEPERKKEVMTDNQIAEMPFVVLFELYTPGGMQMKYTVRAMTEDELIERSEALIQNLLSKKYTTGRSAPAQQSATPAQPPQDTGGGKATCVTIKVETAYQSNKPQLQFECDGMDTLKFTRDANEMVKLLANVRKLDGSPFTTADIQVGRKFPGQWLVEWFASEKDGKTYKNVKSVQSAA